VNLALRDIAPVEGYKYRLNFLIKMQNPTPEGMSSNEEYPILCDIEDAIGEKAEATGAVSAGVVKSEGFLELWFYTQNAEALAKTCEEALQAFEGYQSGYNIAEDPEWEDYFGFLYPDEFSYQTMQNRKVLMQLEKNGDKMEVPREIDHFIYFKEAAQQQAFAKEAEAKAAGADYVGLDEYLQKIKDGWTDVDVIVTMPAVMGKLGPLGRVLGPRGLMPNPKTGTVTMEIGKAVQEVKSGKIDFRVDKTGIVHAYIGKVSFTADKIVDNANELIQTLIKMKPTAAKGTYMKSIYLSSTMSPSVAVDPKTV